MDECFTENKTHLQVRLALYDAVREKYRLHDIPSPHIQHAIFGTISGMSIQFILLLHNVGVSISTLDWDPDVSQMRVIEPPSDL